MRSFHVNEHQLAGRIIADAFADDDVNLWAFNGQAAMEPAFSLMARYLYLRRGFGLCAAEGRAGTLWLGPGAGKSYGIAGNLALARAIFRYGGVRGAKKCLTLDGVLTRRRPTIPHYYLFAIGVHPCLQGQGIGSQLIKATLMLADREGKPAYLENSKPENTPFYQRHGFQVLEEIRPAPGCPPLWLMWRDPQKSKL